MRTLIRKNWAWIVYYAGLIAWLCIYFSKRNNGEDLKGYLESLERYRVLGSPYEPQQPFFKYAPQFYIFLNLFHWIPSGAWPVLFFLVSLLCLIRFTWLALTMISKEQGWTSQMQKTLTLASPWFLVIQGLGAEIEAGQMTLVVLYFLIEGAVQLKRYPRLAWTLLQIPYIIKIPFGIVTLGLLLRNIRIFREHWKTWILIPLALLGIPYLVEGYSQGGTLYREWLQTLQTASPGVQTNVIGTGNLGLYSFCSDRLGMSSLQVYGLVLLLVPVALWMSLRLRSTLSSLGLLLCFSFLFSPVTFLYSQVVLLPLGLSLVWVAWPTGAGRFWGRLGLGAFLASWWVCSFVVLGRATYVGFIIPYRINAWLTLMACLCLGISAFAAEREGERD